jgi:hypothetical protein
MRKELEEFMDEHGETVEDYRQAKSESQKREYLKTLSIDDLLEYFPNNDSGAKDFLIDEIIERNLE